MKMTKSLINKILPGLALLLVSVQAQALLLTPGDATAVTGDNSNLTTLSEINTAFETSYADLELLWKGETDEGTAGQDGSLKDSYLWNFDTPVNSGTIDHVAGESAASCPTCILIVKDGNSAEAQYLFDLGAWDGTEVIALSGFWPRKVDAISNVAIWGAMTSVPEPGFLMLMSLGLVGLLVAGGRKRV